MKCYNIHKFILRFFAECLFNHPLMQLFYWENQIPIFAPYDIAILNFNPNAIEVLVYKGSKNIVVKRKSVIDKEFVKKFMFSYYK